MQVNMNSMNADALLDFLCFVIANPVTRRGNYRKILIESEPGTGKSAIVKQAVAEVVERGLLESCDIIVRYAALDDPTDYKGLPARVDGPNGEALAQFLRYGDLDILMNAESPLVVFLDELGKAPMSVQCAVAQLIQDRRVNGEKISPHVVFVAASNRREDRAGDGGMPSHLVNRFQRVSLRSNVDRWVDYAIGQDLPVVVPAFLKMRPELLLDFDPMSASKGFASPRTWEMVAEYVEDGFDALPVICGCVGDSAGTEFHGFLRIWRELPDFDAIWTDPDGADLPDSADFSTIFALAGALAQAAAEDHLKWSAAWTYAMRLPGDFREFFVTFATQLDEELKRTDEYVNYRARQNRRAA